MSRFDVLVVGAGPAGSSIALRLARAGVGVKLLDAAVFPRSKPCGDCLSPGASPLLAELGALGRVAARAGRLRGWRIVTSGGREAVGRFGAARADGGAASTARAPSTGLALPRRELDAQLLAAAVEAGAELEEGLRTFALLRENGRVTGVKVRDREGRVRERRARVVVGADGLRSVVARRMAGVRRGRRRRLALVGRFAGVTPADGSGCLGEMRLGRNGCLGLAPLGGDRWNATLVVPLSEAREVAEDREAYFREAVADYGLAARFGASERVAPLEITGPFEVSPRRTTVPGALLAGDAAGYFDPLTGQGVHAALLSGRAAAQATLSLLSATGASAAAAVRCRYESELRRLLGPVRRLQRAIDLFVGRPRLADTAVGMLGARPLLADLLVDVTGDRLPVTAAMIRFLRSPVSHPASGDLACTRTTRS